MTALLALPAFLVLLVVGFVRGFRFIDPDDEEQMRRGTD